MNITVFALLFFAYNKLTNSQKNKSCRTDNNQLGICIDIRSCRPIYEYIRDAPKPLPPVMVEFIRKRRCGKFEDETVCCHLEDVSSTTDRDFVYYPQSNREPDMSSWETTTSRRPVFNNNNYETTTSRYRPTANNDEEQGIFLNGQDQWGTTERTTRTTRRVWGQPSFNNDNNVEYSRSTTTARNYNRETTTTEAHSSSNKRETEDVHGITEHPNIALLSSKNCGHLSLKRIANGNTSDLLQYPWMAVLGYRDKQRKLNFNCGGTLISRRYILTAAHCVANLPQDTGKLEVVRLGEYNFETQPDCEQIYDEYICIAQPQDARVQSTIVHPQFNSPKHAHDIALIELAEDADFGHKRIKPICLPVTEELLEDVQPQQYVITGWGTTETSYKSSVLMEAFMSLYPKDRCLENLSTYTRGLRFTEGQFCAEARNGAKACPGDSGGPILAQHSYFQYGARYVQFGIVSFGPNLCGGRRNDPSVFTDVRYYMKWILDSIQRTPYTST